VQKIATPEKYYQGIKPFRPGCFLPWEEVFSERQNDKVQTSIHCGGLKDDPKQNENHQPSCQRQQAYLDSFLIENHIVVFQILCGEKKLHEHNRIYKMNDKFFCGNSKNTLN
jgi:hypothetical protein